MIELKPCTAAQCASLMFGNAKAGKDPCLPFWATAADLEKRLSGWKFIGMYDGPMIVGIMSMNSASFHLDIYPDRQAKWACRDVIRRCLDAAFEGREFLKTSINDSNMRAIRLAQGAGFRETGRSSNLRHYVMRREDLRF